MHSHLDEEFARLRARLFDPASYDARGDPAPDLQRDMLDMLLRSLRSETVPRPRRFRLRSLTWGEARAFIQRHHSHHVPPQGWKFGCGAEDELGLVGVVVVGRPVSRRLDVGATLEVTRLCTLAGARNAASLLLGAACRAAKALGYRRVVTYTLAEEDGTCCRAAGFTRAANTAGGRWSRRSRRRTDAHPTGAKIRWERQLSLDP
ncbi:MAG: hypothetical protein KY475_27540 [Planctomycetes bacterium]|nr:hypothetical protein [Planctomycetota bacterium]